MRQRHVLFDLLYVHSAFVYHVFMRVYFDIFFCLFVFFVCMGGEGVIGIIGGTPDKRISEGLV